MPIQYLNTDLDLKSSEDLTPLAKSLKSRNVMFPLDVSMWKDSLWHATFETNRSFEGPDANIAAMLSLIESLPKAARVLWDNCTLREFNIGYDCGDEPWAFNQGLSTEVLRRMAAAEATLRITIYPERPETPQVDHG